jgi:hypothetical protein
MRFNNNFFAYRKQKITDFMQGFQKRILLRMSVEIVAEIHLDLATCPELSVILHKN